MFIPYKRRKRVFDDVEGLTLKFRIFLWVQVGSGMWNSASLVRFLIYDRVFPNWSDQLGFSFRRTDLVSR